MADLPIGLAEFGCNNAEFHVNACMNSWSSSGPRPNMLDPSDDEAPNISLKHSGDGVKFHQNAIKWLQR